MTPVQTVAARQLEATRFAALLEGVGVDAERVISGLYIGSKPPEGPTLRRLGFRVLALCAANYQPEDLFAAFPGLVVVSCPLVDVDPEGEREAEALLPDVWRQVAAAATQVARLRSLGARTLVTCMAGRNRSGLVTALALHVLTGAPGATCAAHVRASRTRQAALTNNSFRAALEALPGRAR